MSASNANQSSNSNTNANAGGDENKDTAADTAQQSGDAGTNQNNAGTETTAKPAAPAIAKAAEQGNVTTSKIKSNAPQNVQAGAQDKAIATATPKTESTGVKVTTTEAAVEDAQLPEVVEALKVASLGNQAALAQLLEYARDMHPSLGQTAKSIEANQIKLLNTLQVITFNEDEHFAVVWKGVVAVVKANLNACFNLTSRNRGLNGVSLQTIDNKNMRFLTRTIDLLAVTAGVNNLEEVKKHVDFNKVLESAYNVTAKKNLTAFYSAA